jgi:hypothetical protein
VTGRKAKKLSQSGKMTGVIPKVSDDEPASDSDSITEKLTSGIQAPVKLKTSREKGKEKRVALPTLEEEPVSQDDLELLTNNKDILSRGNRQRQSIKACEGSCSEGERRANEDIQPEWKGCSHDFTAIQG